MALSRLFQVPVGWLLGVEEVPEATEFSEDQLKVGWLLGVEEVPEATEFSEDQLKLLEELLGRYQRAEQAELSQGQRAQVEALVGERLSGSQRPRRRWPWALAALAVVWAGWSVFSRLDRMDGQYNSLANSVNNVSHSVPGGGEAVREPEAPAAVALGLGRPGGGLGRMERIQPSGPDGRAV